MVPGKLTAIISGSLAIGAGVAVAREWYGVATTLGIAAVLVMIEAFGEALGATLEQYLGGSRAEH